MNERRKPNAMLIELVIVILFFAISASIILQLFVAAHDRSVQSDVENTAVLTAEDIVERFAASSLGADAFFEDLGWIEEPNGYGLQTSVDGHTLRLVSTGSTEDTTAGTLDDLTLTIYDSDREVVSLPMVRYTPKEDTP